MTIVGLPAKHIITPRCRASDLVLGSISSECGPGLSVEIGISWKILGCPSAQL